MLMFEKKQQMRKLNVRGIFCNIEGHTSKLGSSKLRVTPWKTPLAVPMPWRVYGKFLENPWIVNWILILKYNLKNIKYNPNFKNKPFFSQTHWDRE